MELKSYKEFTHDNLTHWVETLHWAIKNCTDKKYVEKFKKELRELEENEEEVLEIEKELKENGYI